MAIKKAYTQIIDFLQDNAQATVSDVLDAVIEMASAKTGNGGGGKPSMFHKDEQGVVDGIFCYYHKLWMDPAVAEFGVKASSPTGYNNMCKDGVSKWTKQQRDAKKAESALLQRIASGELSVDDLANEQAAIEEARTEIIPRADGYGFATLEELLEA